MIKRNHALFIILLANILFNYSLHALTDEGSVPKILGVVPAITNDTGTITVAYKDVDGAETLKTLRLQIGDRKNHRIMYIDFNLSTDVTRIKTDDAEWLVSSPDKKKLADDYFQVRTDRLAHNHNNKYGWVIIPVTFYPEAIFKEPVQENFVIYACLKDTDGNKSEEKAESVISLEFSVDGLNAISADTAVGSLYKWNGYKSRNVDVNLLWTSSKPLNKDATYYHYVSPCTQIPPFNCDSYILFKYDPANKRVYDVEINLDYRVENVSVTTTQVGLVYYYNAKFTLINDKTIGELPFKAGHIFQFSITEDISSEGEYYRAIVSVIIWGTPTWWLPVVYGWTRVG
jgi:hypothetical protein